MAKLKLWGHPNSINVQKVLWALDELDLKYERIDAGGSFGGVTDAKYLALNPNGLVPTLEDDGAALWESNAIVRYLFAKYGHAPIHPAQPTLRARADAWTDWYGNHLWPHVRTLLVQLVRTEEAQRDHALIENAQKLASDGFGILARELGNSRFVAGDQFTWGDIPVGAAAQRWFNLPLRRPQLDSLSAWYERLRDRPAFVRWIDHPLR